MPLPVRLPPGVVSIYNMSSLNRIAPSDPMFTFGVVTQTYSNTPGNVGVGNIVMFNKSETNQVVYDNITYYLIREDKVIFVENPIT